MPEVQHSLSLYPRVDRWCVTVGFSSLWFGPGLSGIVLCRWCCGMCVMCTDCYELFGTRHSWQCRHIQWCGVVIRIKHGGQMLAFRLRGMKKIEPGR